MSHTLQMVNNLYKISYSINIIMYTKSTTIDTFDLSVDVYIYQKTDFIVNLSSNQGINGIWHFASFSFYTFFLLDSKNSICILSDSKQMPIVRHYRIYLPWSFFNSFFHIYYFKVQCKYAILSWFKMTMINKINLYTSY